MIFSTISKLISKYIFKFINLLIIILVINSGISFAGENTLTFPADALKNLNKVAVKRLASSEINLETSHMHEINGIKSFQKIFGKEKQELRGRFMYFGDKTISTDARLTWYDAARDEQKETWRLYYKENPVIRMAKPGDALVLARYGADNVLAIITPQNSKYEAEVFKLFKIDKITRTGSVATTPANDNVTPLTDDIKEQLGQTGKIPVQVGLWTDVATGEVTIKGKVTTVKDGDTLSISGVFDVRLFGIDAPEKDQTCKNKGEIIECGQQAKDFLTKLILGHEISCVNRKKEKYGRFLSVCTADGVNINNKMVENGMAIIYYAEDFAAAEKHARILEKGLWGSEFINPSQWRSGVRWE